MRTIKFVLVVLCCLGLFFAGYLSRDLTGFENTQKMSSTLATETPQPDVSATPNATLVPTDTPTMETVQVTDEMFAESVARFHGVSYVCIGHTSLGRVYGFSPDGSKNELYENTLLVAFSFINAEGVVFYGVATRGGGSRQTIFIVPQLVDWGNVGCSNDKLLHDPFVNLRIPTSTPSIQIGG